MRDTIYIDTYDTSTVTDIKRLLDADNRCTYTIERMQKAIKELQLYRIELYNQITTIQELKYKLTLKLRREKSYMYKKVFYYVELDKVYEGLHDKESIFKESFSGTERKQAAKKFEELKKQYPGIEVIIETAKGRWEK